jgi:hypothetical protein
MQLLEPISVKRTYTEYRHIVCKCNAITRFLFECNCPAESVEFHPFDDIKPFDVQFDPPSFLPPELFVKLFHGGVDMDYGDKHYRVFGLMPIQPKENNVYSCLCDYYENRD